MFLVNDDEFATEQQIDEMDQLLLVDALQKLLVEKEGYYAMAKAMESRIPKYHKLSNKDAFGIPRIEKLLKMFNTIQSSSPFINKGEIEDVQN